VGEEALLPEEELQPLKKDYYYLFQIIGCSLVTKSGEKIGKVEDVLSVNNNDLLVVSKESREIFVPFTKGICIQVNLGKKEIVIDPPEGLLDLNEI